MKEKFKNSRLTGSITIKMDDAKGTWVGDKFSIVASIIAICEQYQRAGDNLSLRQLYYQLVSKDLIPNHDKVYKKIGSIKDAIVYAGLVDWNVFEDRGRKPIDAYSEESVADAFQRTKDYYKLDRQLNQPNHLEVWTEKDAISGILSKITLPFSVKLVVNKGYTSSTAMYEAYSRFVQEIAVGKKITILYFGDHDPSGLDMIRDIKDRLEYMLINGTQLNSSIGEKIQNWWDKEELTIYDVAQMDGYEAVGDLMDTDSESLYELFEKGMIQLYLKNEDIFNIIPIGLTMEQIRQYKPPHNPAKITDPRASAYVKEFGQMSWEVDALTPDTMRSIVKDKIKDYIDMDIYEATLVLEREHKDKIASIIETLDTE